MKSRIGDVSRYLIALVLTLICARSADAGILFYDNFDGPVLGPSWTASLPDAPWRAPQDFGIATYLGAPEYSFESVDSASVIRLTNVLNNAQRVGWSSDVIATPSTPIICEVRFNTLLISSSTSIDNIMELWLLDASDQTRYDKVALSAPSYGASRVFNAWSSVSGEGADSGINGKHSSFTFASNTWYRMVLTGSQTRGVDAAIWDDSGTNKVLIGVNLGHTLSSYPSGFRVGISQAMGAPGAPYPTDVAIDYVLVKTDSALHGQRVAH